MARACSLASSHSVSHYSSPSLTLPQISQSANSTGVQTDFDPKNFIDSLVISLGLMPEQVANLFQISKVCNLFSILFIQMIFKDDQLGTKIELGDLLIQISTNASQFKIQNMLQNILNRDNNLHTVLADLSKLLEKKWQMNEVQVVCDRLLAAI